MQHDNLNEWLNKRMTPKVRPDLAERIIFTALHSGQEPPPAAWGAIWKDLMSMVVIPHPSVVVATGIILGIVIGMQTGEGLSMLEQDWSSFLDVNEGGWL